MLAPTRPDPRVALGYACHSAAAAAARHAAVAARDTLLGTPAWALVFGGGRHDPHALYAGLRAALGDIPLVGGTAVGLITPAGTALTGFECGLLLFATAFAPRALLAVDGLERDETAAGMRLGAQLRAHCDAHRTVLLLYDSVHSAPPTRLHVGSRLVAGIRRGLGDRAPTLFGGGTLADLEMTASALFDGTRVVKHSAVAVVWPETLEARLTVTHGCLPASDFMTVTALDGARVLELDGRPALAVAAERLHLPPARLAALHPSTLTLTLGEKRGDPYAPFDDGQYVNRLVVGADPAAQALILTEDDFAPGARVQLMAVDPHRMIDSAREQTAQLLDALGGRTPLFGLYIDCAGRSMAFSGLEEDEAASVRVQVGARCPLLGFFSGVEIAPVQGVARPLDWTGVLALFVPT